jgi:hypothetical protein
MRCLRFFVPDAYCCSRDGSHDRGMWRREMDTRERQDIRKERNKQHLPSPHAGGPESAEGMGNGMSQTDPHCVIHTLALFPTSMFFNPRPAPGHVPTQFAGDQSSETQDIGTRRGHWCQGCRQAAPSYLATAVGRKPTLGPSLFGAPGGLRRSGAGQKCSLCRF